MTLTQLLERLESLAAEAEAVGSTAPVANVYRKLAKDIAALDLEPSSRPAEEERLLSVEDAAQRLGVAPRWLYRHALQLPFTRRLSPGVLRFSLNGMQKWLDSPRARPAAPTAAHSRRVS